VLVALTREISPAIADCQLTHMVRAPIDLARAREQHAAYEACLASLGCLVTRLDAGEAMPDSVFIEDTAVVLEEVAILTRPGAESRRPETGAVARQLGAYRRVAEIATPGTMDGGDVLVAGRRIFVGLSSRTNAAAAEQLNGIVGPFGYSVETVSVRACLHLKSAATALSDEVLLMNPDWIDAGRFAGFDAILVDPGEASAANALCVNGAVVFPTAFPRTRRLLEMHGFSVRGVDADELAKAEGAVTCCSLVFESAARD